MITEHQFDELSAASIAVGSYAPFREARSDYWGQLIDRAVEQRPAPIEAVGYGGVRWRWPVLMECGPDRDLYAVRSPIKTSSTHSSDSFAAQQLVNEHIVGRLAWLIGAPIGEPGLTADELIAMRPALEAVTAEELAAAVAAPPPEWFISRDDRIALAVHLERRWRGLLMQMSDPATIRVPALPPRVRGIACLAHENAARIVPGCGLGLVARFIVVPR